MGRYLVFRESWLILYSSSRVYIRVTIEKTFYGKILTIRLAMMRLIKYHILILLLLLVAILEGNRILLLIGHCLIVSRDLLRLVHGIVIILLILIIFLTIIRNVGCSWIRLIYWLFIIIKNVRIILIASHLW